MGTLTPQDIDAVGRDSAPYWAAVLALAVQSGDTTRADAARAELRRLGCDIARRPRPRKPEGRT